MGADHQFPACDVLDWYTDAESQLVGFLEYVPYCASHEGVWSPKLVTILQETCSQLDSLWRWEAVHIHKRNTSSVDITDYFELYGSSLAEKCVVFWAGERTELIPFAGWRESGEFTKESYVPLDWWKEGYQKIKHNRLENRTCATLKRTVEALASLFLALVRCENCWQSLWERHWLSLCDEHVSQPFFSLRATFNPEEHDAEYRHPPGAVESRLFAYRIQRCSDLVQGITQCPYRESSLSRAYRAWCAGHPVDS